MKNIFGQTRTIVVGVIVATVSGLIVNSFTKWWATLANWTNAAWETASKATVNALAYEIPIWAIAVAVVLAALTWYLSRKIGRVATAPHISSPSFLDYQKDTFDGVLCRWDYIRPPRGSSYQIQSIRCLCQHCDFIIGTPNQHAQQCPSCSRRAVKSDNTPYRTGFLSGEDITGYQQRENPLRFQDFIRLEIDRRIRTGHWNNSGLSG